MPPSRPISIRGRLVAALLVAQLVAVAVSALLAVLLVDGSRAPLLAVVAISGGCSFVLTLIAGLAVVARVRARVERMTLDTAAIAKGELHRRVKHAELADVEPLVDSINAIAGQLHERVESLHRLESLRSDFAANVSHELRTPITNIKGYIETLLEYGLDDRDEALRYLDIIKSNSSRLAAIVEDIMALSKFENAIGDNPEDTEPVTISGLLREISQEFEREAEAREIRLVVEAQGPLVVRGHKQLLDQAISNLVSNAIRYSYKGTDVTLRARAEGEGLEIEVADEGPGIEREHLPRLFERFYRVDKARSRAVGGTGLGLAIVKHIALKHNGSVEAISVPGSGSVFRITLPANG